MKDQEVVVVCVEEVKEVARDNNYGDVECPWTLEDFDECGAFTVEKEKLTTNDAWSKACLKIMEEEKESLLYIVDKHTEEMTLSEAIIALDVHLADQNKHLRSAWDIVHSKFIAKKNDDENCIGCVDKELNDSICGECRSRNYVWKSLYFGKKDNII